MQLKQELYAGIWEWVKGYFIVPGIYCLHFLNMLQKNMNTEMFMVHWNIVTIENWKESKYQLLLLLLLSRFSRVQLCEIP